MFAVTFALPEESASFRKLLRPAEPSRGSNSPVGIDARDIAIWHVGVGAQKARERVCALFAKELPRLLCAAGFAGALDSRLRVGDLVVDHRESNEWLRDA